MKTFRTIAGIIPVTVLFLGAINGNAQCPPGKLALLDGYSCSLDRPTGVATTSGEIIKPNGLRIQFEQGLSQGYAVDVGDAKTYEWFYQKDTNGKNIRFALIKKGIKTVWEPEKPRSPDLGSILIASFPIGKDSKNVINFVCEIVAEKDLADALVMLLTYDPSTP